MSDLPKMPKFMRNDLLSRSMSRYLELGFALLIILMATLAGHAVWHINELESRMGDIVDVRNRKIQLATDLQEASYNRHNTLVYQVLADDPFDRDENFQLYLKWGYHVGDARNQLKALPLDQFESENMTRQDQLVEVIIVLQEEISGLAARGLVDQARDLLASDLRPLNLQYTEVVEALRRYERDLIRTALEQMRQATKQAISLHVALGGLLILLAIAIALITRRSLQRNSHIIHAQVSELEKAGSLLEHQATHDPLTGLANRALFYRRLEDAIQHASEEHFSVAVMYIDLDDFKQVNDVHGHAAGDALLLAVAQRLQQVVRKSDTTARLGGDEFALLFVGIETDSCGNLCGKVEREIGQDIVYNDIVLTPSCSIGYAIYPRDGGVMDDLLNAADAKMYESKRARKLARSQAK
jgi:diguanylate cyclase (GGDEF)-like protein